MVTADRNPNLIAFIGDVHGRTDAFEYTAAQVLNRGCTTLVQVGDFWMYDSPKLVEKLSRVLTRICPEGIAPESIDYRFIDGNHENFDVLDVDAASPVPYGDVVTYMPRGTRATLAGASLLFFGGASSVDRAWRTEGKTWWPDESITEQQSRRAVVEAARGPVDILVTHDTTTAAFEELASTSAHARIKGLDPTANTDRAWIDEVAGAAEPRFQIHGHHHTRFTSESDGFADIALTKEDEVGSVAILDTETWTWTVPVGRRDTGQDGKANGALRDSECVDPVLQLS
jgi:hypothetical protein